MNPNSMILKLLDRFGLVDRYESCVGIRLYKSSLRFLQLWICPAGYEIIEHSNPKEHIELMFLSGETVFYRRRLKALEPLSVEPKKMGQTFSVPPGYYHWFKVGTRPLIFINFARFINGEKPQSAAIDFKK